MAKSKGTSAWLDIEAAVLADILQEHYENLPGNVGSVTRSSIIRAGLDALAREADLDEGEVRAEVARRLAADAEEGAGA